MRAVRRDHDDFTASVRCGLICQTAFSGWTERRRYSLADLSTSEPIGERDRTRRCSPGTNPKVPQSQLLAIEFLFCPSSLQCGSFAGQFEFRTCREVLNIILQVVWAWQCLAVEWHLATCCSYKAHSDRECQENAFDGTLIDYFAVHLGCLRVQASSGRFALCGRSMSGYFSSQPVSAWQPLHLHLPTRKYENIFACRDALAGETRQNAGAAWRESVWQGLEKNAGWHGDWVCWLASDSIESWVSRTGDALKIHALLVRLTVAAKPPTAF